MTEDDVNTARALDLHGRPNAEPAVLRSHYPFVTRIIASLFNAGRLPNVYSVDIEPEYGYAVRLAYTNGRSRMTRANDVGLNSGASSDVAKDKAYTKHFLMREGIIVPPGEAFLTRWWSDYLHDRYAAHGIKMRDVSAIEAFLRREVSLPVYVKPVDGSKGMNVWRCASVDDVASAIEAFEHDRVRVILVESEIAMPDYRLVVLDGSVISCYSRRPLTVEGDGVSTILELMQRRQSEFDAVGRDTRLKMDDQRIIMRLRAYGMSLHSVPTQGLEVQLHDISNLSAGGTAIDLTGQAADRWKTLAVAAAELFGLRFCGVDLACEDITGGSGDYAVIELNATPGLDHYCAVGADQETIVRNLYAEVLNRLP